MGPGPNPTRRMSAVHIQSRKQQQQQISCIGSGGVCVCVLDFLKLSSTAKKCLFVRVAIITSKYINFVK